jgi:hypothetical protein
MDEDTRSDTQRREALQLVRAFLGIADPHKRQSILDLAERLADEVSRRPPPVETIRDS